MSSLSLANPEVVEYNWEDFSDMVEKKSEEFLILSPTEIGHFFRDKKPVHILKLEAPELPPLKAKKHGRPTFDYIKKLREREQYQRLRMILDLLPEDAERFEMKSLFKYVIPKRITKAYDFATIANWVHSQNGRWTVRVYADIRKRPAHSFLVFYFEDQGTAAMFKLFQI